MKYVSDRLLDACFPQESVTNPPKEMRCHRMGTQRRTAPSVEALSETQMGETQTEEDTVG